MPAAGGTYFLQITITIRIAFGADFRFPRFWFRMHIDRGLGWEITDTEFAGKSNLEDPMAAFSENYVTMTTTLLVSSATPYSSDTFPVDPGTHVYAGWSAYWDNSGEDNADCFAKWYRITFDVTQVS